MANSNLLSYPFRLPGAIYVHFLIERGSSWKYSCPGQCRTTPAISKPGPYNQESNEITSLYMSCMSHGSRKNVGYNKFSLWALHCYYFNYENGYRQISNYKLFKKKILKAELANRCT